ncbi:unnamed protein product [Blepharisma stoltei]|uniref:Uncharacterized protein n=1 Tax=Blepharisma stoltei TaxID=1481888 RepID=A0AAU9IM68_9CILI|nr:unnamed protein product [Blepharisma stoltei]
MASPSFKDRFQNKTSTMSRLGELDLDTSRAITMPNSHQIHKTVMQVSASNIIKGPIQSPRAPAADYPQFPSQNHISTFDNSSYLNSSTSNDTSAYKHHLSRSVDFSNPPLIPDVYHNLHQKTIDSHRRNFSYSAAQRKVAEDYNNALKETPKTRQAQYEGDYYRSKKIQGGFKPYTLNDYKAIKPEKYYELGGLGPTIGSDDWLKKREIHEKRKEYADKIKQTKQNIVPPYNLVTPFKDEKNFSLRQSDNGMPVPLSPVKIMNHDEKI